MLGTLVVIACAFEAVSPQASADGIALLELGGTKINPIANKTSTNNEIQEVKTSFNTLAVLKEDDDHSPKNGNSYHSQSKQSKKSSKKSSKSKYSQNSLERKGTMSTTISAKLQAKLEEAAVASHKLRRRITWCTTGLGFLPLTVSYVMYYLLNYLVLDPYTVGHDAYWASAVPWSLALMLLGLMPNDSFLIRLMSLAGLMTCTLASVLWCGLAAYAYIEQPELPKRNGDDPTVQLCGDDEPRIICFLFMAEYILHGVAILCIGAALYPNIRRTDGERYFHSSLRGRSRFHDGAFITPARIALQRMWKVGRAFFLVRGLIGTSFAFALYFAADDSRGHFISEVVNGVSWLACVATFTDERRHKIMGFLTAINMEGEANSAATMAALLGDNKASYSLQLAKERFRCISFKDLSEEDFAENKEASGKMNTLFGKTEITKLGKCDAFISHSWHDDGKKKYKADFIFVYEAIMKWALEFKNKNGDWPTVWLDKACIDQSNIADDLLCLPIFTAGCQTLLIVFGPTYLSRLWCIIEIFVFLKMGGDVERITIIPIDMTELKAKSMFHQVDASEAHCYKESDQQKLLGIIEHGFGNFSEFNQILREVFDAQMTTKFMTTKRGFLVNVGNRVSTLIRVDSATKFISTRLGSGRRSPDQSPLTGQKYKRKQPVSPLVMPGQ